MWLFNTSLKTREIIPSIILRPDVAVDRLLFEAQASKQAEAIEDITSKSVHRFLHCPIACVALLHAYFVSPPY